MTTMTTGACERCHATRPARDLLRITPTDGSPFWWVCRPSLSSGYCFNVVVPWRGAARIALGDELAERAA
ncbi:MAG: hypothetical protein M3386_05365 [Actinomycetota bacterium]|nr:hypothetical protein [Actinomycetota bacterium]